MIKEGFFIRFKEAKLLAKFAAIAGREIRKYRTMDDELANRMRFIVFFIDYIRIYKDSVYAIQENHVKFIMKDRNLNMGQGIEVVKIMARIVELEIKSKNSVTPNTIIDLTLFLSDIHDGYMKMVTVDRVNKIFPYSKFYKNEDNEVLMFYDDETYDANKALIHGINMSLFEFPKNRFIQRIKEVNELPDDIGLYKIHVDAILECKKGIEDTSFRNTFNIAFFGKRYENIEKFKLSEEENVRLETIIKGDI